ncbi:MAG: response regulator transcription factor [Chloroflexota bacterium]|nr:MAG: response regulator transcription factor [Chloroflexota bacterium]
MKILIADDHAVVRQGLRLILANEFRQATFGEAQDTNALVEQMKHDQWDVVIMDLSMPGGSGLNTLKEIKHNHPHTPILILSMYPEDQYAVRTLKAGASGYLTKETASEELVNATHKVLRGGKYINASVAEKLLLQLGNEAGRPPHEFLSDREYQVLCMIASGKEVGQIAADLTLSVKTVSTYRARLLEKMNMKTNAELTHYAIENKLVM